MLHRMFNILIGILGFMSVCHFCLAFDQEDLQIRGLKEKFKMLRLQGGLNEQEKEIVGMPRRQVEETTYSGDDASQSQDEEDNIPESGFERKIRLVKVDAAFGIKSEGVQRVYLFIDKQVQELVDGKFFKETPRADFHLPDDMELQAAFVTLKTQDKRIFYGDTHGRFVSLIDDVEKRRLKYGRARAFIRDGGPNAAARKSGKVFVFKGCQVAVRKDWNDWGKPVNVKSIGLPCNVHAAWKEDERMIILKGDQIWRWNADDSVDGPIDFDTDYSLKHGYDLMPVREDTPSYQAVTDYNAPLGQPEQEVPKPNRPNLSPWYRNPFRNPLTSLSRRSPNANSYYY